MNADKDYQQEHSEKEEMKTNTILGGFKETIEKECLSTLGEHLYVDLKVSHYRNEIAQELTKNIFSALVKLNVRGVAK